MVKYVLKTSSLSKEGLQTHNPGKLPSLSGGADPRACRGLAQAGGWVPAQRCDRLALPWGSCGVCSRLACVLATLTEFDFPGEDIETQRTEVTCPRSDNGRTQEVSFFLWCALPEGHLWTCFKYFLGRG